MNLWGAGSIPIRVSLTEELGGRLLVIFDGTCGLCNHSVRWFLCRDGRDLLRFTPSESPKVAELLARHGFTAPSAPATGPGAAGPGTILVVRDAGGPSERVFVRSDAVVALLGELPRPWPLTGKLLGAVPRLLRDLGYRLIARWRYRIWGRLASCPIPGPEERGRFL